jgi:hypothetical protein
LSNLTCSPPVVIAEQRWREPPPRALHTNRGSIREINFSANTRHRRRKCGAASENPLLERLEMKLL